MAEERNLSLTRVSDADTDEDSTKAELQRRMEEARESITQTVTEIKETVSNQYQQVRNTINESLDWREQYRRRPIPFAIGALGVGLVVGYSVAGAFKSDDDDDYDDYDTEDALYRANNESASSRPYAAQAIIGAPAAYAAASPSRMSADVGPETRPSYSSGYEAPDAPSPTSAEEDAEPDGPSLLDRFKETKAYDRLQDEISTLGSRAVEELSKTAQNVILPALLGKLKDMIGIDLSTQKKLTQRGQSEHEAVRASAASDAVTDNPSSAVGGATSSASASRAGGAS